VSDCCLTPNGKFISYIQVTFDEIMMMMHALY